MERITRGDAIEKLISIKQNSLLVDDDTLTRAEGMVPYLKARKIIVGIFDHFEQRIKDLEEERGNVVVEFESVDIHEDLQLDPVWRNLISNDATYTIKVVKANK